MVFKMYRFLSFVKLFARSFSSLVMMVSDLSCFALLPPPNVLMVIVSVDSFWIL